MSGQLYKLNRRKQRWEFSLKRSAVRFIIPRWCSTCRKGQSIKACGAEFIRSCAIKKLISTHEHGFSQRISEPLKILSRPFSEFLCRNERLPQLLYQCSSVVEPNGYGIIQPHRLESAGVRKTLRRRFNVLTLNASTPKARHFTLTILLQSFDLPMTTASSFRANFLCEKLINPFRVRCRLGVGPKGPIHFLLRKGHGTNTSSRAECGVQRPRHCVRGNCQIARARA